jgi:hypothetical protein
MTAMTTAIGAMVVPRVARDRRNGPVGLGPGMPAFIVGHG